MDLVRKWWEWYGKFMAAVIVVRLVMVAEIAVDLVA